MNKLHGIKKMDKTMRKAFYQATGINLPMKLDSDFYYIPEKEKVRYSIIMSTRADYNFQKFLKTYFHLSIQSDIELFCISVLHEFGHFITYDNIAEDDFILSKKEQEKIEQALIENPDDDVIYSRYFLLPLEIMATMWAVEFITTHGNEFKTLTIKVQKNLNKFFKKNLDKEFIS